MCIRDSYRNDSYGGGMIINNSEATLANVTVTDNTASSGGGIFILDTDAILINLTVSRNTATAFGGGLLVGPNTNPVLTNSIIWGNDPTQIQGFGTPIITYSDIEGGWNGVGNIDSDPLFCNPDSSDFTLTENSPCIDAGTADTDGDGNDDISDYNGLAPDMGAFEITLAAPTGLVSYNFDTYISLTWDPVNQEGFQYYLLERSTDEEFADDIVSNYLTVNYYEDDALEYDTEYFYRVSYYTSNWSEYSEILTVTLEWLDLDGEQLPTVYALHQNYPNPFNPITTLRYGLPIDAMVNITIYDMMGRQVKILTNRFQKSGYRSVQWNATNNQGEPVSAGIYLYKIQAGDFVDTKKMILLK